mmetsp:Transcript_47961/g.112769  ORF Transcript_47961/g.112769 Transcript_47961/m.112769 type:complete len:92 (+) Transcript_47961:291-566(+)
MSDAYFKFRLELRRNALSCLLAGLREDDEGLRAPVFVRDRQRIPLSNAAAVDGSPDFFCSGACTSAMGGSSTRRTLGDVINLVSLSILSAS